MKCYLYFSFLANTGATVTTAVNAMGKLCFLLSYYFPFGSPTFVFFYLKIFHSVDKQYLRFFQIMLKILLQIKRVKLKVAKLFTG